MLSILEIAERQFPIVPMKLLLKDPFRSDRHIGDVEVPMLFLHGTADRLIPIDSGRRLFVLADAPKEFVAIEAAGHNNLFEYRVVDRMTSFLRHQLMQELDLPQQFPTCYIAGASFCLMDKLEDAQETLRRVYQHLTPNGGFLMSVFRPVPEAQPGPETVKVRDDGLTISVRSIAQTDAVSEQLVTTRLRYCVKDAEQVLETVDRDWKVRWYKRKQLFSMLEKVGFRTGSAFEFDGKKAGPESCDFSLVAKKPG